MTGDIEPSNFSSMRVLIRPPPPVSTASPPPPQTNQINLSPSLGSSSSPSTSMSPKISNSSHRFPRPSRSSSSLSPPPPPPHPPTSLNSLSHSPKSKGVVVIGFIGMQDGEVSQLINRLIDSDIFGSSNRQKALVIGEEKVGDELKDWFERRKIGYYHDQGKGILYLKMCFSKCLAAISERGSASNLGSDSLLEEHEFGDLQGMLFMFIVCHVVIYIQEGSCFDVEIMKKFRVLQSAKHALALIRSRNEPSSLSMAHSSSSTSKSPSPGRRRGISNRNSSGISLMSGVGLYTSLFPGQCTPVTLFVFLDDFSDLMNSTASAEDVTDPSSSSQTPVLTNFARPGTLKGHGSVVVLARPGSKGERGSRKKIQSALEGQIRFLIKKCRALYGSDYNHGGGSKSGSSSGSIPLLTLDASRTVALLDRSANQVRESLDYACGLVEDVLNGKATSDSLLFERHGQAGSKDDISTLKEFISRQVDILRGRGGSVASGNSSSGGAGMVAVAAAVAAASVSSVKTTSAPELPSFEHWLSSVHQILKSILCAKRGCIDESEARRKKFRQRKGVPPQAEGSSSRGSDPLDIAVSLLEGGNGINMKFSTQWCLKALPSAMDIYLKDLPDLYPTSQHEAHLEKALCAFSSMAKGPAVQLFMKKLAEKCTSVWKSGRQLCDAISLTGKPCMHKKHEVEVEDMPSDHVKEPHSSGFVYLHACACGRSRQLRQDPFDFQTANITFNRFPDCDKLVPGLQLPKICDDGPTQQLSWLLIRIGGSKYYDPYKGLNQSGFGGNQRFLLKWTLLIGDDNHANGLFVTSAWNGSLNSTASEPRHELNTDVSCSLGTSGSLHFVKIKGGVESQMSAVDHYLPDEKSINFGSGLPNIPMKKPFSEVVAGSSSSDLAFPPLQLKRQTSGSTGKGGKRAPMKDGVPEHMDIASDHKKAGKAEMVHSTLENLIDKKVVGGIDGSQCVKLGSNVIPANLNDNSRSARFNTPVKHVLVYVGFEHECPHGHRFILSTELLDELGVSNSSSAGSLVPSYVQAMDLKFPDAPISGQNSSHSVNGDKTAMNSEIVRTEKSVALGIGVCDHSAAGVSDFLKSKGKQNMIESDLLRTRQIHWPVKLDDGGQAFSLLNRNLPIYLNCIHCKTHKGKKDQRSTAKFAGTISQLQRIFVVTPPFPVVLSTNPVVQFEGSFQSLDGLNSDSQLEFSLGSQIILPPESFVSIRLPFVYGVQLENKCLDALKPFEEQPELTAWIKHGTALNLVSIGSMAKSLPTC